MLSAVLLLTLTAVVLALAAGRAHRRQAIRHTRAISVLRDELGLAEQARAQAERTLDLVVHLANRSQVLVDRQIERLVALEREHRDATTLDELVGLDHLAVQVRRSTEAILAVGGQPNPRHWNRALPLIDVVRAAAAEVEGFRRVHLHAGDDGALLDGVAIAEVAHLVAELVDHALTGAGADGEVLVQQERNRITILEPGTLDAGVRLSPAAAAVVDALAARHGIAVRVPEGERGDVVAEIALPAGLVTYPVPVVDVSDSAADRVSSSLAAAPLRALPLDVL